jgi:hypothetical protein
MGTNMNERSSEFLQIFFDAKIPNSEIFLKKKFPRNFRASSLVLARRTMRIE